METYYIVEKKWRNREDKETTKIYSSWIAFCCFILRLNCSLLIPLKETYFWFKILKHEFQEISSLFMKVIPTVHKLLFFKTTDQYTYTKTRKNIFGSYENKYQKDLSEYICRQLKYR